MAEIWRILEDFLDFSGGFQLPASGSSGDATPWDLSQDLGILAVIMGHWDRGIFSWDFCEFVGTETCFLGILAYWLQGTS